MPHIGDDWWAQPIRADVPKDASAQVADEVQRRIRRAKATPRQPGEPLPTHLWHSAWDPESGQNVPCWHAVEGVTERFVYVEQVCDQAVSGTGRGRSRLDRAAVEAGERVRGRVCGWDFWRVVGWGDSTPSRYTTEFRVPAAHERPVRRSPAQPRFYGPRVEAARGDEIRRAEAIRVLGLSKMPSAQEIRAAWRTAAKEHHPDVGGDPAKFIEARAAYEFLLRAVAA